MEPTEAKPDWVVWAIEAIGLWRGKGGNLALAVFVFGLFTRLFDTIPPIISPALILGGLALGALGIARSWPIIRMRFKGKPTLGKLTSIKEKKKKSTGDAGSKHTVILRALSYTYDVEGETFTAESDWVPRKKVGDLQSGSDVTVLVDPANPGTSVLDVLVPATTPRRMVD